MSLVFGLLNSLFDSLLEGLFAGLSVFFVGRFDVPLDGSDGSLDGSPDRTVVGSGITLASQI